MMSKEQQQVPLSICIPTRDRVEILKITLNSILKKNNNLSDFEVVIYDSSDSNELQLTISEQYNYPNLIYKKGANNGFLNLIEALKMGNGTFLKLHNDYSRFYDGKIEEMIHLVKDSLVDKPVTVFTNGHLNVKVDLLKFPSFDGFLYNLSYISSAATTFGIWKEDFEKVQNISLEPMFPHTSLLYALNYKTYYQISNILLFENQPVNKKGGYNLFHAFAVIFIKMVEDCYDQKHISLKTFKYIKTGMLRNFFAEWYYKTMIESNEYTFILTDIKKSMSINYSGLDYLKMIIRAYLIPVKNKVKSIVG
jgi:abequosyltransferase